MEQYLPPPPSGPSPEQFTRTYWSVPRSGTSGDAGVVEYIIPPLRNYMLSIPSQIIPPPVWWTYARHLQCFGNQQRQQMMMLGQSIAEFAILVAARDMKPQIQKEELNVRCFLLLLLPSAVDDRVLVFVGSDTHYLESRVGVGICAFALRELGGPVRRHRMGLGHPLDIQTYHALRYHVLYSVCSQSTRSALTRDD